MTSSVAIRAANIRGNIYSDCAHGCRYCPITRKQSPVALERYENFVLRVREWESSAGRYPNRGFHLPGYHFNYDRATLDMMIRLNGMPPLNGITLGGLVERTDDDCRAWLTLLMSYGLKRVHATIAGTYEFHDSWNNKRGNFQSLMRFCRTAGELGMRHDQRLLLSKATIPYLDALLDILEALPNSEPGRRYVLPFFYQSVHQRAQPHVEVDRIDEGIRDGLPDRIRALMATDVPDHRMSEREWITHIRSEPDEAYEPALIIRLTKHSIDALEAKSIEEIVDEHDRRIHEAYADIPSRYELIDRYGDETSTLVYDHRNCVDKLWLDRFRADNPDKTFDQSLTHFWFGG